MKKIGLGLLLSVWIFVGCGSNDEDNQLSALQSNKWIAESCTQGQDENGSLVDKWYMLLLSFTSDDKVIGNAISYSDKDCTDQLSRESVSNTFVIYSGFYDNGEVEVYNEYKIHDIVVETSLAGSPTVVEAKYAISDSGRVCFSTMLYFSECDYLNQPNAIPDPNHICSNQHTIGYNTLLPDEISYDSCFKQY